jgi:hypothetical protein
MTIYDVVTYLETIYNTGAATFEAPIRNRKGFTGGSGKKQINNCLIIIG